MSIFGNKIVRLMLMQSHEHATQPKMTRVGFVVIFRKIVMQQGLTSNESAKATGDKKDGAGLSPS